MRMVTLQITPTNSPTTHPTDAWVLSKCPTSIGLISSKYRCGIAAINASPVPVPIEPMSANTMGKTRALRRLAETESSDNEDVVGW